MTAPQLSEVTKLAVLAAYIRGDRVQEIADIYRVDNSYPSLLAKRRRVQRRRK